MTFANYITRVAKKALFCQNVTHFDKMCSAVLREATDDVDIGEDDFFDLKVAVRNFRAIVADHFSRGREDVISYLDNTLSYKDIPISKSDNI